MNQSFKVRDYMTSTFTAVGPEMEIMELVSLMVEKDIAGAVVVDQSGRLRGVITERDCIAVATSAGYFDERGGKVEDFMSAQVETLGAEENLMDVAQRMSDSPHRAFPVIDDDMNVVGLLSRRDVLKALTSGAWFKA